VWPHPPRDLELEAYGGRVDLLLTVCQFCGAVEVRDVSFNALAALRATARLAPRRRSDVLGWYAGKRPGGRTYL
jgi:hypothetical protein